MNPNSRPPRSLRPLLLFTTLALLPLAVACATEPTSCEKPDETYSQKILIEHESGSFDDVTVILLCTSDKTVRIIDPDGREYGNAEDFRADTDVFHNDDKIIIPKDFPKVNQSKKDFELITIPARPSTAWVWWLVGGIVVAITAGIGAWLLLTRRRRRATAT